MRDAGMAKDLVYPYAISSRNKQERFPMRCIILDGIPPFAPDETFDSRMGIINSGLDASSGIGAMQGWYVCS